MANIYKDIAQRTGGDIYIGVVGPVRCGKSTLIKNFMEKVVLPNMEDGAEKARYLARKTVSKVKRKIGLVELK